MDTKKQIKQAVEISKLYYLDGATQSQIAKQLNLSRPTVSRALQYARDTNIVKIQVTDPLQDIAGLRQQLMNKFKLKNVLIATPTREGQAALLAALGKATADYLPQVVTDNDVLGISWGGKPSTQWLNTLVLVNDRGFKLPTSREQSLTRPIITMWLRLPNASTSVSIPKSKFCRCQSSSPTRRSKKWSPRIVLLTTSSPR